MECGAQRPFAPWRLTSTTLTVWASEERVRIVNGTQVVADHERSYGRQQRITDDSHLSGMYEQAPGAAHLQSRDRLLRNIPESQIYLDLVYKHQGRMSRVIELVEKLVVQYGKEAVQEATKKSVNLGRHDSWFLKTVTKNIHLRQGTPPALPLYLPEREDVRNLNVKARDLTRYDQLSTKFTEEKPPL